MQGLWLEDGNLSYRKSIVKPRLPEGEILVRVRLAGICRTDLELVRGYYPFRGVIGHEFVGEICDGGTSGLQAGQRVVGEINVACRTCDLCREGLSNHCRQRTVLGIVGRHGAFAEYLSLPAGNLLPVPGSVPDEVAVFTEPLAAALEICEQNLIAGSHRVVLIGAGRLGWLIASVLGRTGCQLQVIARYDYQRKLLEREGIEVVTPDGCDRGRADVVVEASGSREGLKLACQVVRPRGRIVLKSTYKGEGAIDFSRLVVDEVTLIGSRCGPFEPALRLLEKGDLDPRTLISDRFPLSQGVAAFQKAAEKGILKVLIEI